MRMAYRPFNSQVSAQAWADAPSPVMPLDPNHRSQAKSEGRSLAGC